MQPIHLAIGLIEGLITAAVLCFIHSARPEYLWGVGAVEERIGRFTRKQTIGIIAILAAVVGGIVSLFASAFPDGLEWSMERIAGTAELEASGGAYRAAESIQSRLSFLPDYAFKGSESAAGTSVSGIVGAIIVAAICIAAAMLIHAARKRKQAVE